MAEVLVLQLQPLSLHWIFRVDCLYDWLVWSPCSPRDTQNSFTEPQFESINSSVFSLLYGSNHICTWLLQKNHSFDYRKLCWQSDVSPFEYATYFCHSFPSSGSGDRFLFPWAPKSLWTVTAIMKLKDACSLEGKLCTLNNLLKKANKKDYFS